MGLPWKPDHTPPLKDNFDIAKRRLDRMMTKLDPQLKARYNTALSDMEDNDVIAEVPVSQIETPNKKFYLLHRPAVRESSSSTKIRPAFNASAQGPNGVSLNDCLNVGSSYLPSLPEVLLRFRR